MRKDVEAHVAAPAGPLLRLDEDRRADLAHHDRRRGIRNLVGTGLVQLSAASSPRVIALGVLFYLNWQLTAVTLRHARASSAA